MGHFLFYNEQKDKRIIWIGVSASKFENQNLASLHPAKMPVVKRQQIQNMVRLCMSTVLEIGTATQDNSMKLK